MSKIEEGVKIEETDVTHIIRTHQEGKQGLSMCARLVLSEDHTRWIIETIHGDLQQLNAYDVLTGRKTE